MSKEENYLNYKRQGLIEHASRFNGFNGILLEMDEKNNLDVEASFCRPEICKTCGYCCASFPCVFAPGDFLDLNDIDYMRNILDTGLVCISELYSTKGLVIRLRGVGDRGIVSLWHQIKFTFRGKNPCLLNERGCMLSVDYRPSEGLLYFPLGGCRHVVMLTESAIDREYRPYKEAMNALLSEYYYEGKNEKVEVTEENVRKLSRMLAGYKR